MTDCFTTLLEAEIRIIRDIGWMTGKRGTVIMFVSDDDLIVSRSEISRVRMGICPVPKDFEDNLVITNEDGTAVLCNKDGDCYMCTSCENPFTVQVKPHMPDCACGEDHDDLLSIGMELAWDKGTITPRFGMAVLHDVGDIIGKRYGSDFFERHVDKERRLRGCVQLLAAWYRHTEDAIKGGCRDLGTLPRELPRTYSEFASQVRKSVFDFVNSPCAELDREWECCLV